ncbi:M23 family metallopeptidase [Nocardioides lijunqiniae]|uniref:M23 family metallopeptidase n=1 Tax=Nocardioides lijunqiniae TaxID=2760832 RepID=UPI001877E917|nr:M23 family metallopeptidase [Nocardioides lijunqiniae]
MSDSARRTRDDSGEAQAQTLLIAVIAGAVALVMAIGVLVALIAGTAEQMAADNCLPGSDVVDVAGSVTGPVPAAVGPWKREQLTNAAAIINAGAEVKISRRGQMIGVMTAMGESGLRVLDYGDGAGPDSRGLFQQRANGAWGSLADRMNPRISSLNFFKALMKVEGWEQLPPTIAAHRTQNNADPYHYERYWDDATKVYAALAPAQPPATVAPVAASGDPFDLGPVKPQLRALVNVLAPMFKIETVGGYRVSARDPHGHPSGLAADFMVPINAAGKRQGEALAAYARKNAVSLNVDYIIWYQQIWSTDRASEGWRPMGDRGSPTANHVDHVHINVKPGAGGIGDLGPAVFDPEACVDAVAGGAVVYPVEDGAKYDRKNWRSTGSRWGSWHTGTDFSVACGTPVVASHGGTISIESSLWAGPHLTKVSLGPGALTTWYAHMESVTVAEGDVVAAGQQIGTVGSLGNSTGCHLHFEVHTKNGSIYGEDNVNPTTWLAENVGQFVGGTGPGVRVATFNALGHSHTKPGGNKPGWPQADTRTRDTLTRLNAAGLEIVGFQEFQPYQSERFLAYSRGIWSVFPKPSSGLDNAVAWRTDRWDDVRKFTIRIPYFGGHKKPMPVVLLRSLQTGQQVWVGSFHNPADVDGNNARHRRTATQLQAALATRLHATGLPVIWTGDMNDREDYYCPTVQQSPLRSASGGSVRPCRTAPKPGVDWVMGAGVAFNSYHEDWSVKHNRISDHPLVTATAVLAGTPAPRTPAAAAPGRDRTTAGRTRPANRPAPRTLAGARTPRRQPEKGKHHAPKK